MKDKILFQMSKAEYRLRHYMKKKLKERGVTISAGQSGVLFLIRRKKNLKMGDLSKILGIDNSAITRVIDRLEKNGFVKRVLNPSDRRQYLIKITEKGERDIEVVAEIANETNKKIREGFSDNEIDIFLKVLSSFEEKF